MTDIQWLLTAGIAVWLGLGAYVTWLLCAQRGLERRLRRLEMSPDE